MLIVPGTRLGRYEIIAALGSGGMGEVWRAGDPGGRAATLEGVLGWTRLLERR